MDSYLMMLYVTLEQESALKAFFQSQGWAFCKPDLSKTTDELGPSMCKQPDTGQTKHARVNKGKRKLSKGKKKGSPPTKQRQTVESLTTKKADEQLHGEQNNAVRDSYAELNTFNQGTVESADAANLARRSTVLLHDDSEFTIKVETAFSDSDGDVDEPDEKKEAEMKEKEESLDIKDDVSENNEDTDVDYTYEGLEEGEIRLNSEGARMLLDTRRVESSVIKKSEFHAEGEENKDDNKEQKPEGCQPKIEYSDAAFNVAAIIVDNGIIWHECGICQYKTKRKSNFERHLKKHGGHKKPKLVSTKLSKDTLFKTKAACKTPERLFCDQCGQAFKSMYGLTLHKRNKHLQMFKHICEDCGKGYNQSIQFRFHCASHQEFQILKCEHCHVGIRGHSSLQRHLKICPNNPNKESNGRMLTCDECFKEFKSQTVLTDHKKGKHGQKRYECTRCGKTFSWRSSLKQHLKRCRGQ